MDMTTCSVVTLDQFAKQDSVKLTLGYSKKGTITFSRGCVEALDNPKYVHMAINPERKSLVLVKWENKSGTRIIRTAFPEKAC